ncbi:MAG: hypothetical protein RI973_672, partial [Bacteroidota bacterium]
LEYSINGGTSYQSSATFSSLPPGTYNIIARLASNPTCTAAYSSNPVTINAVPTPPTVVEPEITQPTCAVTTGMISVNASGGMLEYSINGGTSYQSSATFSGLSPGTYNIIARLASSPTCTTAYSSNPVTINPVPNAPNVTAPTLTQPTCTVNTGTILVNATGSGVLEYSIDGGNNYQLSAVFPGLSPGNYNIVCRLASNPTCTIAYGNNPVVIDPVPVAPTVTAPTLTQPTCAVPTGTIIVNAPDDGTLEFSVDGGSSYQSSAIFSGLSPGTYNLVARLSSSPTCTTAYSSNPLVIDPVPVAPTVTAPTLTQPTCAVNTGAILVNATGSGILDYSIDGGSSYQSSAAFSVLAPGTYDIVVRLASSPTCTTAYGSNPVVINPVPVAPTVTAPILTQPTCSVNTGAILVNATGSGILEYSIDGGISYQSSAVFSGLPSGAYNMVTRLAFSPTCTTAYGSNPVVINPVPVAPTVTAPMLTQPTCAVTTGVIAVNAAGSGLLEYSVDDGSSYQSSPTFTGLAPGSYNIVVRLASSPTCTTAYAGNPVSLTAPGAPQISAVTVVQPTCAEPSGSISIAATGTGALEYSVDGGASYQTSPLFENLPPGTYDVRVRLLSDQTCVGIHQPQIVLSPASGCCPSMLAVDDTPIASGTYLASSFITSAGLVAAGSSVEFKAGLSVELLPGFEVVLGGLFQVIMEGCVQNP